VIWKTGKPGNNVENSDRQPANGKKSGGITGKGFLPGQCGNPRGRPLTRGLAHALKLKVAEVGPDGRSVEDLLVAALIQEAFAGRNRMAALAYIFDRLEGRPRLAVDLKNITEDLASRSDGELEFFIAHGHWPGDKASQIEAGER
jgi:hypothetical protein